MDSRHDTIQMKRARKPFKRSLVVTHTFLMQKLYLLSSPSLLDQVSLLNGISIENLSRGPAHCGPDLHSQKRKHQSKPVSALNRLNDPQVLSLLVPLSINYASNTQQRQDAVLGTGGAGGDQDLKKAFLSSQITPGPLLSPQSTCQSSS